VPAATPVSGADGRDPQTFAIIGSAIEVHRELGSGFLEPVYQEALAIELRRRNVPFEREVRLGITYKDEPLRCAYRADFVCYGEVIVELKAVSAMTTNDHAQLLNYLKATGLRRGLIINFGAQRIESKRMVL
jgi:GxxExxY protein